MSDIEHDFQQEADLPSGSSFEERLTGATSDYGMLNAESVADLGI